MKKRKDNSKHLKKHENLEKQVLKYILKEKT
jgi:hypothetical protein